MMLWKKVGKIFDPVKHGLPNDCVSHAQSPQVLVMPSGFRCYFSTRKVDSKNEKFLSHVAYADFDKEFSLISVSKHEVIPLGDLGCYDEHGIFPFHVLALENEIYGYISGWTRRASVSVDTGIGLAISSDDGETFARYGQGPVLTASLHEPFLVGDPFVLKNRDTFHMWYIFGTQWITEDSNKDPERIYKIGHACSKNGIDWVKSNQRIIADTFEHECQALPSVAFYDGVYHMVFCYRNAIGFRTEKGKGYRLGYAQSEDLINWNRNDAHLNLAIEENCWDSDMQCYPHLCVLQGKLTLFYNGNEFGKDGFGAAVLE